MNVVVKWNKQQFDVEIESDSSLELLKAQIFALTNVPVDRQKLLVRGKKLNDDDDLKKLKDKQKIMMMGSADVLPTTSIEKIVFEEDLTDTQKATLVESAPPPGLKNLGNTCYLNSTIQCLKGIPELTQATQTYASGPQEFGSSAGDFGHPVASGLGHLFKQMENSTQAVIPMSFYSAFKQTFPQFGQTGPGGVPMQQDADESLSQLLFILSDRMGPSVTLKGGAKSLFEGEMASSIKNTEDEKEPVQEKKHSFNKLRCHISIKTDHLHDGIKDGLVESIEKNSPVLGRNAIYEKTDRISKLPPYLMVQFVRFFWKVDTQKKAKILRKVVFPMRLDVLSFCTSELQAELSAHRSNIDIKLDAARERKKMGQEDPEEMKMQIDDENAQSSGIYELFGVITHKGRAADSGHYIGWVKDSKGDWYKYDDDLVTQVKEDDIKALSGGGDWHMAYILFYRSASWRSQ